MSSYSDFDVDQLTVVENRLKMLWIDSLNPKPQSFILNRNPKTIVAGLFVLIFIYFKLLLSCSTMMTEVYLKNNYFRQKLEIERNEIHQYKEELNLMFSSRGEISGTTKNSCQHCFRLFEQIDRKRLSRFIERRQPIKAEYNETLEPLQHLLVLICLLNNMSIIVVYEKAFKLFFLSTIFNFICQFINVEVFIEDRPSVYYTLVNASLIISFTSYFLFKIVNTLVTIRHYQLIKNAPKTIR